jgi:DNA-binding NtrC family response regulator
MLDNTQTAHILLVDDDEFLLRTAELMLSNSYVIHTASSVPQAKLVLKNNSIDVIVCDLNFEGHDQDGLQMMDWTAEHFPDVSLIVLSGDESTQRVVGAMLRKPIQFVTKTGDYERDFRAAIEVGTTLRRKTLDSKSKIERFQTRSPKMEKLLREVDRIVKSGVNASILITGESGTGKEFLAKHIASAFGKKLTSANMAGIQRETAESELFGHMKGSFTGAHSDKVGLIEQAHRGIFFLDELGDCSLSVQAKLLRVIQEGELRRLGDTQSKKIAVQFVAATNKNLSEMIDRVEFRLDLYQRLSTFTFQIPALREWPEDIQFYTTLFLNEFSREFGKNEPFAIQASGLDVLLSYPWPGNVRELYNVLKRIAVLSNKRILDAETATEFLCTDHVKSSNSTLKDENQTRLQILKTLEKTGGNRTRAAALLGVDPSTLFRKLKKFGISEAVAATHGRPTKPLTLSNCPS